MTDVPGSPEWLRVVTASKCAAILGVSPWESQRSIWHRMRNELPAEPQTGVQSRGHYLEPAVLSYWRDEHLEFTKITRHPTFKIGDWAAATPDASASGPDLPDVLVEAKSANRLDDWGIPGTDMIPTHYLVQVYFQLHLSGLQTCYVPIIGPYLEFEEYRVEYDPEIGADLEARCKAFYDSLSADTPPPLDDSIATFDCLRQLHPDLDRGVKVEVPYDLAAAYLQARADIDDADARHRAAASQLYDLLGTAHYAVCNGVTVARRQVGANGVYLRKVATTPDQLTREAAA